MRCDYTHFKITRRFGVPQAYKQGEPLQLVGSYGSIGILIRHLVSRILSGNEVQDHVLGSLARVGVLIGRPLTLKRNDKNELDYDKEELRKLTELAAPDASLLDINGGKMTFEDYTKKDKTWQKPEWEKYGQSEEEVKTQTEKMNKKRAEKRTIRTGRDNEDYRIFYFGTPVTGDKSTKTNVTKISLSDLITSDYFSKHRDVRLIDTGKGLKIAFAGGSSHNKTATKKFYGSKDAQNHAPLKGNVVIILTHDAPLDMQEYMEPDEQWLVRYREENNITNVTSAADNTLKDDIDALISNKRQRK
jgi:hypothetical protein